ncbi:hypothetical protein BCV69DRAFT_314331 [Microstroma glucosiphilum]|uniref:Zn(2)-C6 fungal-type domain-containing protein n=1 Tax=Pseudomicrostroma glucosiphilum TaxID=1684307 RepID=A0A316U093_9BASI|nr:hypothetical protein BCV69DRAFT_314331 [Pseudomicrostroma glucosiphilum]PWN18767.1 hypothetical protein BCV69DRAFT_314331 [Pseudomicrostroma glucosiphilum]
MSSEQWESNREWHGAGPSPHTTATPYDAVGQHQGPFAAEQPELRWQGEPPDHSGQTRQQDYGNAPGPQGSVNAAGTSSHDWAIPALPTRTHSGSTSWPPALTPSGSSSLHRPSDSTGTSNEIDFGTVQDSNAWFGDSPLLGTDIPSYHGLPVPFPPHDSSATGLLQFLGSGDKVVSGHAVGNPISGNLETSLNSAIPYTSETLLLGSDFPSDLEGTASSGLLTSEQLWGDASPSVLHQNTLPAQQEGEIYGQLPASHTASFPGPWLPPSGLSPLSHEISAVAGVAQHTPFNRTDLSSVGFDRERTSHWAEEAKHFSPDVQQQPPRSATTDSKRPSNARMSSSGCSECQKHALVCDIQEKTAERRTQEGLGSEKGSLKCSHCEQQGQECTVEKKPVIAKKHGRPSRTGRRIEQARLMHGSVKSHGAVPDPASMPNDPGQSAMSFPGLDSLQRSTSRLPASVISGAVSLRLLTCFFATAHIQMPIVDFASFSSRYNLAKGDARIMSIMLNGGDEEQDIPSMSIVIPGLKGDRWPDTGDSTISTPGTSETLIAVMQAWAAHYTDMPIAFGSEAEKLGITGDGRGKGTLAGRSGDRKSPADDAGSDKEATITGSFAATSGGSYAHLPPSKRPKRKQGVACDTCRLRRVRCDLMERKDGMPCSRCQDKKIVCTDDYIQTKRRKSEAKNRKEKERLRRSIGGSSSFSGAASDTGSSSAGAASSDSVHYYNSGLSMADQLGDNPDPLAWTEVPATPEILAGSAKFPSLVPLGQARQAFCHDLLTRAVVMVHKHQLLYRPSVEAVQALVLLVQLFYLVDPAFASEMTTSAASHMRKLGLQSVDEIDETDQRAVTNLFNLMQLKRVWCSSWTGDAIATCVYRRLPNFKEEKAITIRSSAGGGQAGSSQSGVNAGDRGARPPSPMPSAVAADGSKGPGAGIGVPSSTARAKIPELTPEMGLSFSVMAMMQIGVLARFVTKHVDGIAGPTLLPPQERFPMLPTSSDNKKLSKACHAVWKSNEALIAFFDRCTLKSWRQMEALKIFQPKSWIAAVKITSAMIILSVYRILGERHRLNADYLSAVSRAHGAHVISSEDAHQSRQLKELFQHSSQKALLSCRRVARLVEKILQKPSLTFQTGGIFQRQIFAIAQFLARTELEKSASMGMGADGAAGSSSAVARGLKTAEASPPPPSKAHVDPRSLSMHATGTFIPVVQPEPYNPSPSDLYDLALDFDAPLPVFDAEARRREVSACTQALDQLGFAWPMEEELESVNNIVRGGGTGRRFGHALA